MLYLNQDGERVNLNGARCEDCHRLVNALTGNLVLLSDGLYCPPCMTNLRGTSTDAEWETFLQNEGATTLEPALYTV